MISPEQRAELRRLRAALPPQPLAFVYFETLRQVCAADGNPDNGLTHIADEPASDDTSAWLEYVAKAATLAPALLEALESAEARATNTEQAHVATVDAYIEVERYAAQLEAQVADARDVIARGVAMMTIEQLARWTGVRAWQETPTDMYLPEGGAE